MKPETYYDDDVRRHEFEYRELAHRYLADYSGNFPPLLARQQMIMSAVPLGIKDIRLVLNCMLVDMRVKNMPMPDRSAFDAGGEVGYNLSEDSDAVYYDSFGGPEKRTKHRRPQIVMKSKVNYDFGISNHVTSHVVHLVDHNKYPVTWYPYISEIRVGTKWICQSEVRNESNCLLISLSRVSRLLDTVNANGKNTWKMCNTCWRIHQERGSNEAERQRWVEQLKAE